MFVGWWADQTRCVWMNEEVYGIFSNKTTADNQIHTFILTNENDKKRFFEDKHEYITTNNGDSSWGDKVTIGSHPTFLSEAFVLQVYEVICFDKAIDDPGIIDIFDTIFA